MAFTPDIVLVYPPELTAHSTAEEHTLYHVFSQRDGIAAIILTTRLTPTTAAMLPPLFDPITGRRRTARDILDTLRFHYGITDFAQASLVKEGLWNRVAKPDQVPEFVLEWRHDLNVLNSVSYNINWAEAIMRFALMLPNDVVWETVRVQAMEETSNQPDTLNRASFEFFADLVLKIHQNPLTSKLI
ncbi:hypothetical protein MPER_10034 [Moniliophthora perniciosa FA553]|nr:hypothetical protein MPER_10034 [Moniliophthora perniciosa FA553]